MTPSLQTKVVSFDGRHARGPDTLFTDEHAKGWSINGAKRFERPLLPAAPARIRHPTLGRVLVDQIPGNRPIQHLPQRLRRLEAMPLRNRQPPRTDPLRRE